MKKTPLSEIYKSEPASNKEYNAFLAQYRDELVKQCEVVIAARTDEEFVQAFHDLSNMQFAIAKGYHRLAREAQKEAPEGATTYEKVKALVTRLSRQKVKAFRSLKEIEAPKAEVSEALAKLVEEGQLILRYEIHCPNMDCGHFFVDKLPAEGTELECDRCGEMFEFEKGYATPIWYIK